MAATTTLSQLRTDVYDILKQPEDCKAYPYSLVDRTINAAVFDLCMGGIALPETGEIIDKMNLPFLNRTQMYTSAAKVTISGATTVGAITLDVSDCTYFPTAGSAWMQGDVFSWTGKVGTTQLTGVTGINFAWPAGSTIYLLYAVPADFGQMTRAYYTTGPNSAQYQMVGFDYRNQQESSMNQGIFQFFNGGNDSTWRNREFYYTILNDVAGQFFLPLLPQNGYSIRFDYQKMPTSLSTAATICDIPDQFVRRTVPYLAAAEVLYNRGEADYSRFLERYGFFRHVKNFVAFYQTQGKELIFNQRVRTQQDGVINI
jgi:hypothetical protein